MRDRGDVAAPVLRRRGGLVWHRDFRSLWLGETVSRLGSNVTVVALPLVAVVTLHAGTFEVGLLTTTVWLPWLVFGLPAGVWLERVRRRPVMLACDVVSAVAFASVPLAARLGLLTIGQLIAVAFLAGSAGVVFATAYRVYLPALVGPADLPEANAKLLGSESAAQLGGRGVAGLLAQAFGAVVGLLADAVSFLVSAVCLLTIRATEPPPERAGARRLVPEVAEGLRWVATDPYLRSLAVFGAVANVALTGCQALQVVFLVRTLGAPASAVGGVVAASGIGGVLASLVATPLVRRAGSARGLVVTLVCTGPFGLLIPLAFPGAGIALAALGVAVLGVGVVVTNVVTAGFRQSYPPPGVRARVMATSGLLTNGAGVVGAVVAGWLGADVGVRPAMWIMAGIFLCAVALVVAGPVRGVRNLPVAPGSA